MRSVAIAPILSRLRELQSLSQTAPAEEQLRPRLSVDQGWRWPDFTAAEMGCRHCAQVYHWPDFMNALQTARDQISRPFHILSAHRCSLHNARVGGAPRSEHLRLAVDIDVAGHDRLELLAALRGAGFTGFGFYTTFIHADMGRTRRWFGTRKARTLWQLA